MRSLLCTMLVFAATGCSGGEGPSDASGMDSGTSDGGSCRAIGTTCVVGLTCNAPSNGICAP